MRPAVVVAWRAFSVPLESLVHHMYLDILGLVTTGVGNLVDPVQAAIPLPWRRSDGSLATKDEVVRQWTTLKENPDLAKRHYRFAKELLDLRYGHALLLTDDDIDVLVSQKLESNERELRKHFPLYDEWPADAQLALHSMAWAMGPAFSRKFPTFTGIANKGDFAACGTKNQPGDRAPCDINEVGNPGVVPRNQLNREHFVAAGSALARMYPDVLHGPCTLYALKAGWKRADIARDEFGEETLT